jgi:hypothetical protein
VYSENLKFQMKKKKKKKEEKNDIKLIELIFIYVIIHLLTGIGVICKFIVSTRHKLLPEAKPRSKVGIKGNNKLAVNRISSQ